MQRIGLAKAAQLLGISRGELQKLVRRGVLRTFEGCVDLEQLLCCYPSLILEDEDAQLERVTVIQNTAFSRRVRETVLPDTEDLAIRLKIRTADLEVQRNKAEKYQRVLKEMAAKLASLQTTAEGEQQELVRELNLWLLERLRK